ncbi:unnamed protein product [Cylicostephanus goldi]|uniref:Uncharacterized protein n=1 Tax=Cylicostephanus goldi TaxID=71465 RepID=A0A3P6R7Z6_CYLGO|nr:unnamed protein product [Cylicostephanus goldi]
MKSIFDFFLKVISEPKVEWEVFESAYFGKHRTIGENSVTCVRLYPDLAFEEFTQSPDLSRAVNESRIEFENMSIATPISTGLSNLETIESVSEQSTRLIFLYYMTAPSIFVNIISHILTLRLP